MILLYMFGNEIILLLYCLLMMENNFIAGSANIDELDPERQVKVVENIANMESASPAAVKIVEAARRLL